MSKKIIAIGKNSNLARFTGQYLSQHPDGNDWLFISHSDIEDLADDIQKADVVINFAAHPDVMAHGVFNDETNLDAKIAKLVAPGQARYIMLSSRTVYGEEPQNPELTVDSPLSLTHAYGLAKSRIEHSLADILSQDRLCILRLTNIIGFNDLSQKGFAGFVFSQLANKGHVELNWSPETKRDFLPQEKFCEVLVGAANNPVSGTYNLGSGVGISVKSLGAAMASGFGAVCTFASETNKLPDLWLDSADIYAATSVTPPDAGCVLSMLASETAKLHRHVYPSGVPMQFAVNQ